LRAERNGKSRVAIIGTGRVGTDLLFKALSSPYLDPVVFVGRNHDSEGLRIAKDLGVEVSSGGIEFLQENSDGFDYLFDATSAQSHRRHNAALQPTGKFVVDLTPAKLGALCVPYAIRSAASEIDYIEVVSSISSKSSGLATRENIDEYLTTTESSLMLFSKARRAKAILNINPADPDVCMQTSIYAYATFDDFERIGAAVAGAEEVVKRYVPGYEIVLLPVIDKDRITLSLTVHGRGDYLP
jgi:acetaldehyde dehydrogenase